MIKKFLEHKITIADLLLIILAISTFLVFYISINKPIIKTSEEKITTQIPSQNIINTPKIEVKEIKTSTSTLYKVLDVVDGDTIKVLVDGESITIRLIGIDTPETKDPRKPVQCFAKEASKKATELLGDKQVYLEVDPSQGERDKYNRLLRYVFLENGTSYQEKMIRDGYAHEYTYNLPYKYQKDYKEAEVFARNNKLGFWSANTCNGDTKQEAKNI